MTMKKKTTGSIMKLTSLTLSVVVIALITFGFNGFFQNKQDNMKYNTLTPEEEYVILHKGTEAPYTGEYTDNHANGIYVCKQCNALLYRSTDKFDSHCGWPGFDDEIEGAVIRKPDADGMRTEITCARCGGHLGHVFEGEGYTDKNIRHCVNSISLKFIPESDTASAGRAIFASGCFWGTEYYLQQAEGVISTTVGYTGGHVKNPTYSQVCSDTTGHAEAVEVIFDPEKISYEAVTKLFFETHDPAQVNRQGPDIGTQYRSEIFYLTDDQRQTAEKLKKILIEKGLKAAPQITPAGEFYPAETYHQDYYQHKGTLPYCHRYIKRF